MQVADFVVRDAIDKLKGNRCDRKKVIEDLKSLIGTSINFNGVCVCGKKLELAYNYRFGVYFWNCFKCFPTFRKVLPD